VCKWQAFEVDCGRDSVVFIDRALFGRMRLGSCLTEGFGHVGCVADVGPLIERRCAGRHDCHVQLPDVELDRSAHGCPADLLSYLEVEFHCQIGKSPLFSAWTARAHCLWYALCPVHIADADATQLNSTVASRHRRRCVLG